MTSSLQVSVGFVDSRVGMGIVLGGTAGQDETGEGKGLKLGGWGGRRTGFPPAVMGAGGYVD